MIFRQFQGLFPMPVCTSFPRSLEFRLITFAGFETGVRQAYQWTLLAPYIKSCPRNNPRIEFQNFSTLVIENQPFALGGHPAISTNRSLTAPGRKIELRWEATGKVVGYDGLYRTAPVAGAPKVGFSLPGELSLIRSRRSTPPLSPSSTSFMLRCTTSRSSPPVCRLLFSHAPR